MPKLDTGGAVRSYLDRWSRQVVKRGLRSGLLEGSNLWLAVGAIVWLIRFLSRRQPPLVRVERLREGESLTVSNVPSRYAPKRELRRIAERQAKKERRAAESGPLTALEGDAGETL